MVTVSTGAGVTNALLTTALLTKAPKGTLTPAGVCPSVGLGGEPGVL